MTVASARPPEVFASLSAVLRPLARRKTSKTREPALKPRRNWVGNSRKQTLSARLPTAFTDQRKENGKFSIPAGNFSNKSILPIGAVSQFGRSLSHLCEGGHVIGVLCVVGASVKTYLAVILATCQKHAGAITIITNKVGRTLRFR